MQAEREYKERVLPDVRRKIEELKQEVSESFQKEARIAYLKEQVADAIIRVWELTEQYEEDFKADRVLERLLIAESYTNEMKAIWRTIGQIRRLNGNDIRHGRKEAITRAMIERAREHPFTELHEFKRNMGRCPFHDDRTPSMSLKNNRARCWGACNKSWDTIEFIMERDGLTFPEAVRRLQ